MVSELQAELWSGSMAESRGLRESICEFLFVTRLAWLALAASLRICSGISAGSTAPIKGLGGSRQAHTTADPAGPESGTSGVRRDAIAHLTT